MKKIIASIAAAGVLVAGAFAASTITASEASAQTDEAPAVIDAARRIHPGAILDGVLGDLVEDGTLTEDQAAAVKDAMADKAEELRDKFADFKDRREDRMERRREMHEKFLEWLSDGVITADELSELDVDLPIHEDGPLAEALEDGQITQEEWDAIIEQRKADREARIGERENSVTG
ncbi:MAG: hypothetical protein ABFR95_07600 [Actinomycetota bacterium]